MPGYLTHLTLDTGHSRISPREEVAPGVVAALTPLVADAVAEPGARITVAAWPAYALEIDTDRRAAMVATIWARSPDGDAPAITLGVARNSRGGAGLWRRLCGPGAAQPPPQAPWLAVRLLEAAAAIPVQDLSALADLERCIAWTWLEGF